MSNMQILWYIPTGSDKRYLGTNIGSRVPTLDYVQQVGKAVDSLGFTGALIPTGNYCEDAWITASTLIPITKQMKFLVAVRPGAITSGAAIRMAATFDRFSQGRLILNITPGGDPIQNAGDGTHLEHDERYEYADEFLTVWRAVMSGETVDFQGKYLDIRGSRLEFPPVQTPHPPLWLGGSSAAAQRVAAKHIDFYLTWGEPPEQVAKNIATVRQLAAQYGRTVRFGLRLHVVVRETASQAWDAANDLLKYVDDAAIAAAQKELAKTDSEGQRRVSQLHNGSREALEVSPNLWAGIGLVRGGNGLALVGDPDSVAARMLEYHKLGIDAFIFSAYPHLEEAYRFAELLFPRLPLQSESTSVMPQIFSSINRVRSSENTVGSGGNNKAKQVGG